MILQLDISLTFLLYQQDKEIITVCPSKESGHLMEDQTSRQQAVYIYPRQTLLLNTNLKKIRDYLAYWLSYTQLSDRILLVDKLQVGVSENRQENPMRHDSIQYQFINICIRSMTHWVPLSVLINLYQVISFMILLISVLYFSSLQ